MKVFVAGSSTLVVRLRAALDAYGTCRETVRDDALPRDSLERDVSGAFDVDGLTELHDDVLEARRRLELLNREVPGLGESVELNSELCELAGILPRGSAR